MATTANFVKQYTPAGAADYLETGSTANIWRHPTLAGVVIKSPATEPQDPRHKDKFRTEVNILKVLGAHPRIIQYLGCLQPLEPSRGLLFIEAANGSVQHYLNTQGSSIDDLLRLKWCKEAAEALYYCHTRKVLHCDLRPDNMLLNADLDLSLCDFGGSKNEEHDGGGLPDYGFFDPRSDSLAVTEATELFGLGSSMYTIMVGHLPHGPLILKTAQERLHYAEEFERLGLQGNFPDTSDIKGGDIISGCWTQKIKSAKEAFTRHGELDGTADLSSDLQELSGQLAISEHVLMIYWQNYSEDGGKKTTAF